jgi:hypothetical protein
MEIREARYETIDEMRKELRLPVVGWPPEEFIGFERTTLAHEVVAAKQLRRGPT